MNNQKIKSLLKTELNLTETYVTGDNNHIKIIVIGDIFIGMSEVQRQKIVYTPLMKMITKQHIHAISIFSYTCKEWKKHNKHNNNSDNI
ncbi:hypothetical protein ATN01_01905 [Buchnera aphidicola (Diuraphis noxia)]|uniref:BolA family transcriptional regulator n=1 Tax=Buchnera aphidicola subsp. Diuraphis noxia TaxID=118101 RepID=A0A1B2H980_BUCDN|nr:BolA family protein [Buchnera aphidicola]ANZ22589.1 hypothetical protein ATN01_01905 [Buchnera aphidicola (Diuraphis noxia)]